MEFIYAILWNDSVLEYDDIKTTCHKEKWIPVFTYRTIAEPDVVRLVCFKKESQAKKFAKINLPRDWLKGTVKICAAEMKWCRERGWKIVTLDNPVKIMKRNDLKISHEILEFQEEPGVYANRACES